MSWTKLDEGFGEHRNRTGYKISQANDLVALLLEIGYFLLWTFCGLDVQNNIILLTIVGSFWSIIAGTQSVIGAFSGGKRTTGGHIFINCKYEPKPFSCPHTCGVQNGILTVKYLPAT